MGSADDKPGDIEMAKVTSKSALLSKAKASDSGAAASAGASAGGGASDHGAAASAGAAAGASAGRSSRTSRPTTPPRPRPRTPSTSSATSTSAPSSFGTPAKALAGVLVCAGVGLGAWWLFAPSAGRGAGRGSTGEPTKSSRPTAGKPVTPAAANEANADAEKEPNAENEANAVPQVPRWYRNGYGPATELTADFSHVEVGGDDLLVDPQGLMFSKKAFHHSVFVRDDVRHNVHEFELLGGAGMLFDKPVPSSKQQFQDFGLLRGSSDEALVAKVTGGSKGVDLRTVGILGTGEVSSVNYRRYIPLGNGVAFKDEFIEAILQDTRVEVSIDANATNKMSITAEGSSVVAYNKEYNMALMYTYQVKFRGKPVFTVEPAGAKTNSYDVILDNVMAARVTKVLKKTGPGQTEEETLHVEGVSRATPAQMSLSQIAGTWWTLSHIDQGLRHRLVEVDTDGSIKTGVTGEPGKIELDEGFAKLPDGLKGQFGQNADEITWRDPKDNLKFTQRWTRQDAKGNTPPEWTCDITALTEAKPKIKCDPATYTEITEIPNLAVTKTVDSDHVRQLDQQAVKAIKQNPGSGSQNVYRMDKTDFKAPQKRAEYQKCIQFMVRCPALAIRYANGETPMYLSTKGSPSNADHGPVYNKFCNYAPFFKTKSNEETTVEIWFHWGAPHLTNPELLLVLEVYEKRALTATIEVTTPEQNNIEKTNVEYRLGEEKQPADKNPALLFWGCDA